MILVKLFSSFRCWLWNVLRALGVIRTLLPIIAILFMAVADMARCADTPIKPSDEEPLSNLLAGEYDLIGRKPDSTTTYTGRVTLRAEGADLAVIRIVNGKTQKGIARFETVAGADRIPVLRMHPVLDGVEYQATYRWQTDLDNYVRLTGILFRDGTKFSGLEALFPIHQ